MFDQKQNNMSLTISWGKLFMFEESSGYTTLIGFWRMVEISCYQNEKFQQEIKLPRSSSTYADKFVDRQPNMT